MPLKKRVLAADTESAASAAGHPDDTARKPLEPASQAPDRETQIREAAYAAYERRGGAQGDAVQDWLDAEAQWERDRNR